MEEKQKSITADWRDEISDSSTATLKILDGENATIVFLDGGTKVTHPDYGTSIVFQVNHENEDKRFFVKENNFAFLAQIKALGKLTGKGAKISRIGSKKSDTRYSIEEIPTS